METKAQRAIDIASKASADLNKTFFEALFAIFTLDNAPSLSYNKIAKLSADMLYITIQNIIKLLSTAGNVQSDEAFNDMLQNLVRSYRIAKKPKNDEAATQQKSTVESAVQSAEDIAHEITFTFSTELVNGGMKSDETQPEYMKRAFVLFITVQTILLFEGVMNLKNMKVYNSHQEALENIMQNLRLISMELIGHLESLSEGTPKDTIIEYFTKQGY